MNYVFNEDGSIKVGPNNRPLYLDSDGQERELSVSALNDKINNVTAESNERRKKLSEVREQLAAFSGIEDPQAAISALQTVKTMDKDQKAALENMRTEINTIWEGKQKEWEEERSKLNGQLFTSNVSNKFATSKVVKGLTLTPDIAQAFFGKHFAPDGTATDAAGNKILSKDNPGKDAGFDEALSVIIDQYPNKDAILRSSAGTGSSGFQSGDGGGVDQPKTPSEKIAAGLEERQNRN